MGYNNGINAQGLLSEIEKMIDSASKELEQQNEKGAEEKETKKEETKEEEK